MNRGFGAVGTLGGAGRVIEDGRRPRGDVPAGRHVDEVDVRRLLVVADDDAVFGLVELDFPGRRRLQVFAVRVLRIGRLGVLGKERQDDKGEGETKQGASYGRLRNGVKKGKRVGRQGQDRIGG